MEILHKMKYRTTLSPSNPTFGCVSTQLGQLIFNKGGKKSQWEKIVSSASGIGEVGQPHANQWSEDTPSHHTKRN